MPLDPQLAGLLEFVAAAGSRRCTRTRRRRRGAAFRTLAVDYRSSPRTSYRSARSRTLTVPGARDSGAASTGPREPGRAPTLRLLPRRRLRDRRPRHPRPDLPRHLPRRDAVVRARVDYRLAPEHPFPAGVEDAVAADALGRGPTSTSSAATTGWRSAATAPAATCPRSCAQQLPRRWSPAQVLIYPATDAFGEYPSRVENAEGYFLDLPTMEWFIDALRRRRRRRRPRRPAALAAARRRWPGCRRPSSSPRSSTRCATRARPTPRRSRPPASRWSRVRYDGMIHGFMDMGPFSLRPRPRSTTRSACSPSCCAGVGPLRRPATTGEVWDMRCHFIPQYLLDTLAGAPDTEAAARGRRTMAIDARAAGCTSVAPAATAGARGRSTTPRTARPARPAGPHGG